MSTYIAKLRQQKRLYRNWLLRLRVGDVVGSCYDGKSSRQCPGVVVRVLSRGTVFVRFRPYCANDGGVDVVVKFVRGAGWLRGDGELGVMTSLWCRGDFYRLREYRRESVE